MSSASRGGRTEEPPAGPARLALKGSRAQKRLFSPPSLRSLALLSTTALSTPSVTISGMRERAGKKPQGPAVPRRDLHYYPGDILETRLERRGQWAPLSRRPLTLDVHYSGLLPRREKAPRSKPGLSNELSSQTKPGWEQGAIPQVRMSIRKHQGPVGPNHRAPWRRLRRRRGTGLLL